MTQKEVQQRCHFWQRRLRLADWQILVKVEPLDEMPDYIGQIIPETDEMRATIRLREDMAASPDPTIVHELLHLRLLPFSDGAEDEPNHEEREQAINLIADCFFRAYPKRGRKRRPEAPPE